MLLLLLSAAALGEEKVTQPRGDWSIGIGIDLASGSYGNTTTTRFVAIPVILQYSPTSRLSLGLEVPWVYQSNSVTTYGSTAPSRNEMLSSSSGFATSGREIPVHRSMHGGGPGGSGHLNLDPDQEENGLGDASVSAGYIVREEGASTPQIGALFYLKIPLANEDKGLGSGEFDEGAGLSLSKISGFTRYFGSASYIFRGKSAQYETKNYLSYTLGISHLITLDLQAALSLAGTTAPFIDAPAPLEARIRLSFKTSKRVRIEGYLGKGLSDGSPDIAAGVMIFRSFL